MSHLSISRNWFVWHIQNLLLQTSLYSTFNNQWTAALSSFGAISALYCSERFTLTFPNFITSQKGLLVMNYIKASWLDDCFCIIHHITLGEAKRATLVWRNLQGSWVCHHLSQKFSLKLNDANPLGKTEVPPLHLTLMITVHSQTDLAAYELLCLSILGNI